MDFFRKLEKKFGGRSIKHLTKYIIIAYVIGYILYVISNYSSLNILSLLALNPGAILRGQVWRIVSWIFVPPSTLSIFTFILLLCYYQLGTALERIWGDFTYNCYIFIGLIMTVVGAFIIYFAGGAYFIELTGGLTFSTYYVSLSIFLGFAMTFPEEKMMLFFIIPIKIKYLAAVELAYLTYKFIVSAGVIRVQIACSLAGFIVFLIATQVSNRKYSKRRSEFKRKTDAGNKAAFKVVGGTGTKSNLKDMNARHKCHICGRTELDDPNLEFRYCSKCNGNYEYCSDHLFTHKHVE